ncbi:hypothetical protein [Ralstonia solanacearum]|uniref:hypothetical protein n=1 Tax=Ralstonia solanacearum TaxID=305 RepID=UPI000E664BF9|nr:hypothetical protein [Ralstonia solanacearum]RIJ84559.1 hypothetical protein RSP822_20610 [Ralstonia solanacearum]
MKKEENPPLTAADLVAKLQANPEFLRKQQEQEQARSERVARIHAEEAPLLADLHAIGLSINFVSDLVNTTERYEEAIPVLLRHLLMPYSDVTRETIARSLAVPEPEVQKAWPLLIEEYRKAPMGWGIKAPGDTKEYRLGAKDGLACALSAAVTDETLPELIALAKDRTQGESRVLLLSALKKRRNKNPLAKQAIEELASDPDLEKEIASWRK